MLEPLGVGIDVEDRDALDHLPDAVIRRAAARWLDAAEHAWWLVQPSARESLIVALSCKEAAYKAWNGAGASTEVRLALHGTLEQGRGSGTDRSVELQVEWQRRGGRVVAVAIALPPPAGRGPQRDPRS